MDFGIGVATELGESLILDVAAFALSQDSVMASKPADFIQSAKSSSKSLPTGPWRVYENLQLHACCIAACITTGLMLGGTVVLQL